MPAPFIVGLCGASGSGKSTLSESLADKLRSDVRSVVVLHGDSYFFDQGPPPAYASRGDLEGPETVNWDRLVADIDLAVTCSKEGNKEVVVIVEGFLIFWHKHTVERCHLLLFLEAGKAQCCRRRVARNPQRPTQECNDLTCYFERCVWPAYEKYIMPVVKEMNADPRLATVRVDAGVGEELGRSLDIEEVLDGLADATLRALRCCGRVES